MNPNAYVRLTERAKAMSRAAAANAPDAGYPDHIDEFGECVGFVIGEVAWPDGTFGPEVDVRWLPSRLRYAYPPDWLEEVPARVK